MILDEATRTLINRFAAVPTAGVGIKFSEAAIDLNPDYGNGQQPRRAPWPGSGEPWLIHCRVFAEFTDAGGTDTGLCQFHAVLSDTGLVSSANYVIAGTAPMPFRLFKSTDQIAGYRAADLAVGDQFYIPVAPWTATCGLNQASAAISPQILRYLSVAIAVPNHHEGGNTGFALGTIEWNLVKHSDISQNPEDMIYPSGRVVI